MKRGLLDLAGLLTFLAQAPSARPVPQHPDPNGHCAWLAERIHEVEAVKVGMSRRAVMKVLNEDQGMRAAMFQRNSFRYEHPACEYIKVDITFKLVKSSKTGSTYLDDTVSQVSHVFLDLVSNKMRF